MTSSVLIVDDHAGFRTAARSMLEEMGLAVVGEADSGETALESFEHLRPDIVLLDIQLPGIDGIEVARRLLERDNAAIVILTSSRDAEDYGARLKALPDAVFIGKTDLSPAVLAEAVGDTTKGS